MYFVSEIIQNILSNIIGTVKISTHLSYYNMFIRPSLIGEINILTFSLF